jgi:hypothetical protein
VTKQAFYFKVSLKGCSMTVVLPTVNYAHRDYGMLAREAGEAVKAGPKSAEWNHSDVARKDMKELMKRVDGPAIRDTIIWLGLMVMFAAAAIYLWPSWWAALPLAAYGVLYGSASDPRWLTMCWITA